MPFQKGQSGNPGGRPRVLPELRDLARRHASCAIATLLKICQEGKSETARIAAANSLLDRGFGRPGQSVEVKGSGGPTLADLLRELDHKAADA